MKPNFALNASRSHAVFMIVVGLFFCVYQSTAQQVNISYPETIDYPELITIINVTNPQGQYLAGLGSNQFRVYNNGKRVSDFTVENSSVESVGVVLLIDQSGSMWGNPLARAKSAAIQFTRTLSEKDDVAVFLFHDDVEQISSFGTSQEETRRNISRIGEPAYRADTELYDAMLDGIAYLDSTYATYKSVVVLSDGEDRSSEARESQVMEVIEQSKYPVFTIALGNIRDASLRRFANASGGRHVRSPSPYQLEEVYRQIATGLKSQYKLTFEAPFESTMPLDHTLRIEAFANGNQYVGERMYSYSSYAPPPRPRRVVAESQQQEEAPAEQPDLINYLLYVIAGVTSGLIVGLVIVRLLQIPLETSPLPAMLVMLLASLLGGLGGLLFLL